MALDQSTVDALQAWVNDMVAQGRVATREPATVNSLLAGQLASRLAVPDPSLGAGPAQWDYELAPFTLRVADNWATTSDELNQALMSYSQSVLGFTSDLAGAVGDVAHVVVTTAGEAAAAAIGIPTWALWGALALGGYYVLTHVGQTRQYVKSWAA